MMDFEPAASLVLSASELFSAAPKETMEKGKADYVTNVDIEVQSFIQEGLNRLYPEIPLLSEEQKQYSLKEDGSCWILDPVDGTTNLIHDYRQSAVSLALYERGEVVFGVIYNPFTKELFTAEKGKGAYLNGKKIHASVADSLQKSLVTIGTSPYDKSNTVRDFEIFRKVFLECQDIRRSGSAALDLAFVACGRLEAFFERSLKPWDYAAGTILVTEAGGKITDLNGDKVQFGKQSGILAANSTLHERFLKLLQ